MRSRLPACPRRDQCRNASMSFPTREKVYRASSRWCGSVHLRKALHAVFRDALRECAPAVAPLRMTLANLSLACSGPVLRCIRQDGSGWTGAARGMRSPPRRPHSKSTPPSPLALKRRSTFGGAALAHALARRALATHRGSLWPLAATCALS
eukprot:scaffold10657_cov194-Isochrysis_galbana.AAC.1